MFVTASLEKDRDGNEYVETYFISKEEAGAIPFREGCGIGGVLWSNSGRDNLDPIAVDVDLKPGARYTSWIELHERRDAWMQMKATMSAMEARMASQPVVWISATPVFDDKFELRGADLFFHDEDGQNHFRWDNWDFDGVTLWVEEDGNMAFEYSDSCSGKDRVFVSREVMLDIYYASLDED